MRVLLITDWVRERGGVEAYVGWLREGLRTAGDEVKLLTSSAGSAADGTADYEAYGSNAPAMQALLQIVNPFAVARVRAAVRDFRPDVVHVSTFEQHLSPAILHALRGVPTILSLANFKVICPIGTKLLPDGSLCAHPAGAVCWRSGCISYPHWLRDKARYALLRLGITHPDRLLSCSRWLQGELAAYGVDTEHLYLPAPAPSAGYRRAPDPDPLFVFCGRLSVEKGAAVLLKAFAAVHRSVARARLRVVGDGPQRRHLEGLARDLALDGAVAFTGWVDEAGVDRELAGAWALVAPSLWGEALGLIAVQAILRGVPVIASSRGGFSETVEEGISGMLVGNGDQPALEKSLEAVALGRAFPTRRLPPEVMARLSRAHSVERHVERLREIYREVVARNGRFRPTESMAH